MTEIAQLFLLIHRWWIESHSVGKDGVVNEWIAVVQLTADDDDDIIIFLHVGKLSDVKKGEERSMNNDIDTE